MSTRARDRALAAAGVGLAIFGAWLLLTNASDPDPEASPPEGAALSASPPAGAVPPEPLPARAAKRVGDGSHAIRSGGTLELEAASLAEGVPVSLLLELGEPSTDGRPRPVRVLAPDGRLLETEAALGDADRRSVRLEIEPGWLVAGRTILEVETTERSHFPLRRYAVEVR